MRNRPRHPHPVLSYWLAHRFGFLFYTLVLTLFAYPLLAALGADQTLLEILVSINLMMALHGMRSRRLSHALLVVLGTTLTARLAAVSINLQGIVAASTVPLVLLGFVAGIDAVRVAMSSLRVSGELLYAALSVYMLFGVLFGILHWAVAMQWPASYSVPEGGDLSLHAGIYFSFATQTTLGFGDILPRSEVARGLAVVQAVAAQLYLAVMVARLVSISVGPSDEEPH